MNKSPSSTPPPEDAGSDLQRARDLLGLLKPEAPLPCLLSTLSPEGRPHATWMFASRSTDADLEILTITSPDSDKIQNLHANRKVEWLITSKDRLQQLYLEGDAEIIEEVSEIRRLWNMINGKQKQEVFFMKFYNSGLGFSIVRTRVTSAIYVAPEAKRKVEFNVEALTAIT